MGLLPLFGDALVSVHTHVGSLGDVADLNVAIFLSLDAKSGYFFVTTQARGPLSSGQLGYRTVSPRCYGAACQLLGSSMTYVGFVLGAHAASKSPKQRCVSVCSTTKWEWNSQQEGPPKGGKIRTLQAVELRVRSPHSTWIMASCISATCAASTRLHVQEANVMLLPST